MNVLIVSQFFWPESFRINDIANWLANRGYKVTVLTGKPNYPAGKYYPGYHFLNKAKERYGLVEIIRCPIIPRGKTKILLTLNYLSFAVFGTLFGLFYCNKPDVIFVFQTSPITAGLPAIFIKKIKKVPVLFWVQDLWPETLIAMNIIRTKFVITLVKKLVAFIYRNCNQILTTSLGYFPSIKNFNISEDQLHYLPQTAEDFYRPLNLPPNSKEEQLLPPGFRIIFSGNIGTAQSIETILNAANLLRNCTEIKWIFLGDGSKRDWLVREIKRKNLANTVFWLGSYPASDMPKFFSLANLLLVTLKKDPVFSVTIPAKIQSYLACGKPILAALEGEAKRIVEEAEAGYVANCDQPEDLARLAIKMKNLGHEGLLQLGKNARAFFEKNYERQTLMKQLEKLMLRTRKAS